jgi:predicted transcriptional regulator
MTDKKLEIGGTVSEAVEACGIDFAMATVVFHNLITNGLVVDSGLRRNGEVVWIITDKGAFEHRLNQVRCVGCGQ